MPTNVSHLILNFNSIRRIPKTRFFVERLRSKWPSIQWDREYILETGSNLHLNHSSKEASEESRKKLVSHVSTKQLLEFTPKVNQVFGSCKLRQTKENPNGIHEFFGKKCNSQFKVVRYLSNTDFCLRFGFPRRQDSLSFREVAFDPSDPGIMQSITLNNTLFANVTSFKVFYTLDNSTGYKELETAPRIDRGYNYNDSSAFYSHFGIRNHVVSSWLVCSEVLNQNPFLILLFSRKVDWK